MAFTILFIHIPYRVKSWGGDEFFPVEVFPRHFFPPIRYIGHIHIYYKYFITKKKILYSYDFILILYKKKLETTAFKNDMELSSFSFC